MNEDSKYSWQKKHQENKTGHKDAYKPIRIKKDDKLKNMKLGNCKFIIFFLFLSFSSIFCRGKSFKFTTNKSK